MHGKGKLTYPDGSYYDGTFSNGLKFGYGEYIQPDGSSYKGHWD